MLWSIDSCQNRVSADQYRLTVSRLRCRPIKVEYLFKLFADNLLVFKWSQAQILFKNSYQICCVYVTIAQHYYDFDFKLTSDAKIQPVFFNTGGEDLFLSWSSVDQTPSPTFMLWLVKIWQVSSCVKFMQHILKVVYFDSWNWQSFESTSHVFKCLFPLNVQNEIQLLSRVFCYSWLVCLLGFWLRNVSLVKADNPISDGIVFVFHLAGCVREL